MFTLVYTRDGETRRHALCPGDTVVGRAAVCDLAIDDPSISRRHARFRIHGDHCVVTDLGGRNGTFLDGEHISEAEVEGGATVVLGRFPLLVEYSSPVADFLSDAHTLLASPNTILRKVDGETETGAGQSPSANPERLLLLLSEISKQLVRWRPLPETLDRIVSVVFDTIPVERAFLLLIDDATGEPIPEVVRRRDGVVIEQPTLSRTVVRKVIADRVAILASDAAVETRFAAARSVHDGHIRSFMCAPLWNQNTVIGVLYVDNPHTAQLTTADLDVLQALSSYAAVAIEQARLSARVVEETRQRELLERYHSAAVVDRILASRGPEALLIAEEREVSVLFADIVGFTRRAEHMAPSAVAQLLNQCLGQMSEAVFDEEGMLDKFIGDAVLAVFGAPLSQADHAERALRTAEAMRRRVAALEITPAIELRIAINSGVATVGDIGTPRRREYTVLGDVVNTCSRLVSAAECAPGQILLTSGTRERLARTVGLRPVGCVTLRGRGAPVDVFAYDPSAPQNE